MTIELLSIDLSNYCSKQCSFCYNHSTREGNTLWKPSEVIEFAKDCICNGVKSISLGGGEPFEYEGIFEIIKALYPLCYLSITSNGLPLEDKAIWNSLLQYKPDKIHLTIHHPNNINEVDRVENMMKKLGETGIKPGLNLLVGADNIEACNSVYNRFISFLGKEQIILVPQRFSNTPTPKQLAYVAGGSNFQSPSCLLGCKRPSNFCSVSWDKKVNSCSYAQGKEPLDKLSYEGVIEALNKVKWVPCS